MGGRVDRVQVSRVDLCSDFHIPGGLSFDFLLNYRVSQSDSISQHMDGNTLETFYCAKPNHHTRLRIYDKSKEIIASKKPWFWEVWDIEPTDNVWRIEYQLRREVLRAYHINTIDQLVSMSGAVWQYLTESWFSLRQLDDSNTSRRSVHPFWSAVQSLATDFGSTFELDRKRAVSSLGDPKWYISHCAGCLASYAAVLNLPDMDQAIDSLINSMREYWQGRGYDDRVRTLRLRDGLVSPEGEQL